MRIVISILVLCFIVGCKPGSPDRYFFDKVLPDSLHTLVFNTDTACYDSNKTTVIKFHEYNEPIFSLTEDGKKTHSPGIFSGLMTCSKNGLYLSNNENPKPQLLFPFVDVGDNYYFVYRHSIDTFKYIEYYKVKLNDNFYDPDYSDTIYKITRSPDTIYGIKHMFAADKIFFIGKHVGLVGLAMPIYHKEGYQPHDFDEQGLIMYFRLGNIYHKKYRYSLKGYNWE
jgi:hypothetical protein